MEARDRYRIEGREVSQEAFETFERALTNRRDLTTCAETATGGQSRYEATAPDGARFFVTSESALGHALRAAVRLPTD